MSLLKLNVFQHEPDPIKVARKKVRVHFSKETADLIEEVTQPVDSIVTQAIFKEPILIKSQSRDKTPRETGKL